MSASALPPVPKPYLSANELAAVTPWTVEAIKKKVQRGELRRGVHYFQERQGERLIFKWAAIVELIESGTVQNGTAPADGSESDRAEVIAIEEATKRLRRLLG